MEDQTFSEKPIKKKISPPIKPKTADRGAVKYLTPEEVMSLVEAAQNVGRHGHRDATLILVCFRHALRVGELITLRWEQIDLDECRFHVKRMNKGKPSVHKLLPQDVDALLRLKEQEPDSEFVFISERGGPLTRRSVHSIVARAGKLANMQFAVYPYMLRHAKGFQLGSKGVDIKTIQDYLGHRNIQHTATYAPDQSNNLDDLSDE